MMQPAENRNRTDTITGGQLVPMDAGRNLSLGGSGIPGPNAE